MDGLQQSQLALLERKNRRLGLFLAFVALGLFIYSFVVIRSRGQLPTPQNLTPLQKILRGL
jgi:hypothetical protein